MREIEEQERRIIAVLGTKKLDVTTTKLKTYLKHLKQHAEFPCELTGSEDFDWEGFYLFGPGSEKEYKKMKKTQPSSTDKFNLISFVEDVIEDHEGILVNVQRIFDKKRFVVPLADLEVVKKKSKNYRLLDDYSVWFVNNR